MPREDKKQYQKTRFAADTTPVKAKSGNIIGENIYDKLKLKSNLIITVPIKHYKK